MNSFSWNELDEVVYTVFCGLTKLRMQVDNLKSSYSGFCRLCEEAHISITDDLDGELSECGEAIECFMKRVDTHLAAEGWLKKIYAKFLRHYDNGKERELKAFAKFIASATACLERETKFHHEVLNDITDRIIEADLNKPLI